MRVVAFILFGNLCNLKYISLLSKSYVFKWHLYNVQLPTEASYYNLGVRLEFEMLPCSLYTVDPVIFMCLNFHEFLILDFSLNLEFVNFYFSPVALL